MGVLSWKEGDHKTSLDHYMSAIGITDTMPIASKKEKRKKNRIMARIHTGLGNTCLDMQSMETGMKDTEAIIALIRTRITPGMRRCSANGSG